jgi:hypothetical protein
MRAGSIGGRKITFIYYDDAVNPAKIVAQVPRLIDSGEVAFPFSDARHRSSFRASCELSNGALHDNGGIRPFDIAIALRQTTASPPVVKIEARWIPRLPRPTKGPQNRAENTAMAMRHAQFISAKRLAVATIHIFAPIPILRVGGTGTG